VDRACELQDREAKLFEQLINIFPSVDETHLAALSEVWSIERDQIIQYVMDLCRNENGSVWPIEARSEVICELAKLIIWLDHRIVQKKLASAPVEQIDPNTELTALEAPEIRQRIENTARICADQIWKPFLKRLQQRFPLITEHGESNHTFKTSCLTRSRSGGVAKMHYSPRFSNRYWALFNGNEEQIRKYWLQPNGEVQSKDIGYRGWGRERFLYSQRQEDWFQLVESDACSPYTKLLNIVPLSEQERRQWIAFLITQMIRTPSFMLRILPALKRFIKNNQIEFPTHTENLRMAYETLFSNNKFFAEFYRLISTHQWELWRSPRNGQFIRSDNPILLRGSVEQRTWQLIYPMTPFKCFVAGPNKEESPIAVVPKNIELVHSQLWRSNEHIAKSARRSVIGQPLQDDSSLRALLKNALGAVTATLNWQEFFPEFWGPIK
jgi:hypothetical protein